MILSPSAPAGETEEAVEGAEPLGCGSVGTSELHRLLVTRNVVRTDPGLGSGVEREVLVANGSTRSIRDWARVAKLDFDQRLAFEVMVASFLLTFHNNVVDEGGSSSVVRRQKLELKRLSRLSSRESNLVCFLHGSGGSGKSMVIGLVLSYAKEFCEELSHPFHHRTVVVTAMSGVAATLVRGETTHKALHLNRRKALGEDAIAEFKDTRLIIIDEVSFARAEDIEKISDTLIQVGDKKKKYGGFNVVLSGDMRQLKPVSGKSFIVSDCPEFHEQVNTYIELRGRHRFRNDPAWGELLERVRLGRPSREDLELINTRVIGRDDSMPKGIQTATHANIDRDAINTAIFEEHCNSRRNSNGSSLTGCLVVLLDDMRIKRKGEDPVPVKGRRLRRVVWKKCGESNLRRGRGKVDPALKLYRGCPVMLTENESVRCGRANGTKARVSEVVLKTGERPEKVKVGNDTSVDCVLASQVKHVKLVHRNPDIVPREFFVEPKRMSFEACVPYPKSISDKKFEYVSMTGLQLGFVSDNATTGHKLQGSTLETLFVHSWHYEDNWVYVVLSRVKSLNGLFLRRPLSTDLAKYDSGQAELERKLSALRNRCPLGEEDHITGVGGFRRARR